MTSDCPATWSLVAVRKLLLLLSLCLRARGGRARCPAAPRPPTPAAGPTGATNWIDFGAAGARARVRASPGRSSRVSSGDFPAQVRQQGAVTIHFDHVPESRVGLPTTPADPATIARPRATGSSTTRSQQSSCPTPWIAENELSGAGLETPWSVTNAQYRANVLRLSADACRPRRTAVPAREQHAVHRRRGGRVVAAGRGGRGHRARDVLQREAHTRARPDPRQPGAPRRRCGRRSGASSRSAFRRRGSASCSASRATTRTRRPRRPEAGAGLARRGQVAGARRAAGGAGARTSRRSGRGAGRRTSARTIPTSPRPPASGCGRAQRRSATGPGLRARAGTRRRRKGSSTLPRGSSVHGRQAAAIAESVDRAARGADRRSRHRVQRGFRADGRARLATVTQPEVLAAEHMLISARFSGSRAAYYAALVTGRRVAVARARASSPTSCGARRSRRGCACPGRRAAAVASFYESYPGHARPRGEGEARAGLARLEGREASHSRTSPRRPSSGWRRRGRARCRRATGSVKVRAVRKAQPLGTMPLALVDSGDSRWR